METNVLKKIKLNEDVVNHLRFKEFGGDYLITNDFGYYHFLSPVNFRKFLEGKIEKDSSLYGDLYKEGFIKRDLSKTSELVDRYACRHDSLSRAPSLHIVVTTARCNYNCIYCQMSSVNMESKGYDMTKSTAKKVVKRILETPRKKITILFQGGEPLANWEIVKFIVNYVNERKKDKKIDFAIVSNLSLLNEDKFNFLLKNRVGLCTSLDGPRDLQNKNRFFKKGDSYENIVKWINRYKEEKKKNDELPSVNALMTTTKFSLEHPKEIVNEYFNLGFSGIHLRKLNYGGKAKKIKSEIGYSIDDFFDFWKKAIERIIQINKEDIFYERGLLLRLRKIFKKKDANYLDLSSPCGAVLGQVLYDYNGDLYTCDEGRMVENDFFKIGHIDEISYEEMISSDTCKAMVSSSMLENQACDLCPYKPYCGVCPVQNYTYYGTLFPNIKSTDWCKLNTKMFDYIFKKLKKGEDSFLFEKWIPGLEIN